MNTHYHEQFWVVLGTVAPVVILADILLAAEWTRARYVRKLRQMEGAWIITLNGTIGVLAILISFALALAALIASLDSLAAQKDVDGPGFIDVVLISVLALLGGTFFTGIYRASAEVKVKG